MVKVSGQNCFRTLSGSLGQIRLGLPRGSAEGSTKVPPRFHQSSTKVQTRFHQSSTPSFVVSLVLWGRSVLGCQEVLRKVPPRFHQGFTKVPPKFHSKFCGVSGSLGQIHLGLRKVPSRLNQGSTKVPLQVSWCLWFCGADPSWGFRGRFHQGFTFGRGSTFVSQIAVWVPPTVLYICLPVLFWGQSYTGC